MPSGCLNLFATIRKATSARGQYSKGACVMSPTTFSLQLKAVERRLKLALESKDLNEIHSALREMTRLQHRRAA